MKTQDFAQLAEPPQLKGLSPQLRNNIWDLTTKCKSGGNTGCRATGEYGDTKM
jgi:hypothetical protein